MVEVGTHRSDMKVRNHQRLKTRLDVSAMFSGIYALWAVNKWLLKYVKITYVQETLNTIITPSAEMKEARRGTLPNPFDAEVDYNQYLKFYEDMNKISPQSAFRNLNITSQKV